MKKIRIHRHIFLHILICISGTVSLPCLHAAPTCHEVRADSVTPLPRPLSKREMRKMKLARLDSLRLRMRQSANDGNMLLWADSLIRNGKEISPEDSAKYMRRMQLLAEGDKKLSMANKLITDKYYKKNIDTAYISRPSEPWTVKFRGNASVAITGLKGNASGTDFSGHWASRVRATVGAAVSYRGLGLSFALNPAKLAGKSKDMEYKFTSYGNRMGFDIVYEAAKTDTGTVTFGGEKYAMPRGTLNRQSLAANFYYAFNGKRFSFPAAFTQSYIQRRSAGSWLVGGAIQWRLTGINPTEDTPLAKSSLKTFNIAIGGGYAHNFCFGKWMLHLSTMPTVVVFDRSRIKTDSSKVNTKYRLPNFYVPTRGALLYRWKRNFAGATFTADFSTIGNKKHLEFYNIKWRSMVFYGFRF